MSCHSSLLFSVHRVLVYYYKCPGQERQSTGFTRLPSTQAPAKGSVSIMPTCAKNSDHSDISNSECIAEGERECVKDCIYDQGYDEDRHYCEGMHSNSITY